MELATHYEIFTEEEVSAVLEAIHKTINVRFAKDEPVPKTILVDFFGTQKSMKTSTTGKIEQVFRRHKFKAYCPPETAEHEGIRSLDTDNPIIEQAKHLNGVRDQTLYLSHHPRAHFANTSRGLIDMLYWYEKGLRKGVYSEIHVQSVNNEIYELLKLDLVDAFFFFTCSVEVAMKREYEGALTQKRGSKMNEKDVADTVEIYNKVIEGVNKNVPGLPIFRIDTSSMDLKQAGEEVLKYLLPTICSRFKVPEYKFMLYSLSLVQKRASRSSYFEEQLKLSGHPDMERVRRAGWQLMKDNIQTDTYLVNSVSECTTFDPDGEVLRLRQEDGEFKFMYKGASRDRLLSHRRPFTFRVDDDEARHIANTFKTIAILRKRRLNFRKDGPSGDHFFTLHLDSIDGLGNLTEIRARGSSDKTHTGELLHLAEELGFSTGSIVEGNYLALALAGQKS